MSLSDVWWLQQTDVALREDDSWLSPAEAEQCAGFRFTKRRNDWRLGRFTAKLAVARYLGLPQDPSCLASIEIRPAASGAPEVFISRQKADVAISLSHRGCAAMCAVAEANMKLGCDLELIEPRSQAFVGDYFTREERDFVTANSEQGDLMVPLIWSAKESALKLLRTGLRDDTRSVSVCSINPCVNGSWAPVKVRVLETFVLSGWWQRSDRFLRTLLADPAAGTPLWLK